MINRGSEKSERPNRGQALPAVQASEEITLDKVQLGRGAEVSQSRRQELLADLHKKVSISAEFISLVEDLQSVESQNIPVALRKFKSYVRDQYPEVSDELLNELRELSKSDDVQRYGRYLPELLSVKNDSAAEEYMNSAQRFRELHRNSDLVYVDRVLRLCDSLEEKAELVRKRTKNPFKEINATVRRMMRARLGKSKLRYLTVIPGIVKGVVKSVEPRNFAIVVTLAKKKFEFIFGEKTEGFMLPKTPFCFIKDGLTENKRKLVIDHEVVHQLIDGNEDWISHVPPVQLLGSTYLPLVDKLEENREHKDPEELAADRKAILTIFDEISHSDLCRYMRHEYFASLNALRDRIGVLDDFLKDMGNEELKEAFDEQMSSALGTTLTAQLSAGLDMIDTYRQQNSASWAEPALKKLETQLMESLGYHLCFPSMVTDRIESMAVDHHQKAEALRYAQAALRTIEPTEIQRIFDLLAVKFNFQYTDQEKFMVIEVRNRKVAVIFKEGKLSVKTDCGS